jgi:hypothetical protein
MKFVLTFLFFLILVLPGTDVSAGNNPQSQSSLPYLTVPNIYTGTPAALSFLGPLTNSGRTNQFLIHENQLTALVGQYLDGLTWRIPTSAAGPWPTATAVFTS